MTLQALLNKYEIKHFTEHEIRQVSSAIIPVHLYENIIPTLLVLDAMRKELGFPITLTDGFRTWEDHERIYHDINTERVKLGKTLIAVPNSSAHLSFNALDSRPTDRGGIKLMEMKTWLKQFKESDIVYKDKKLNNSLMGIGFSYRTFVHSDTRYFIGRETPARW